MNEIEQRLSQSVPADLRAVLLEADGVGDGYTVGVIWPVERIITDNIAFRTFPDFAELYQPFEKLIFFGASAGGDQFAYRPDDSAGGIFVWEHETDERGRVADDLADYLRRRLTSEGDDWYSAHL